MGPAALHVAGGKGPVVVIAVGEGGGEWWWWSVVAQGRYPTTSLAG